jgi:GNAT superfamily N-acetyltransferase
MTDHNFSLRELQSSDSPALVKLISSFDGDMTTQFQVDAYSALIFGIENQTLGVGVEFAGFDGLVGMGTVRFSQVSFNGETLPLAFLDGLKVHKDFRGQGLGHQIARWRIQRAREVLGENCVIVTGMLRSNDASRAVARKWSREFIDTAFQPLIIPVRKRPPKPLIGVQVRELAPNEYKQFTFKQNAYYQNHNLYPSENTDSITHALEVSVGEKKPYIFYVATESNGDLIAGAKIWRRSLIKTDLFSKLPLPVRLLNKIAHIIPPDFILRDAAVIGFWHEPGQVKTAQFLWETLRWELREQATTLALTLDPRDPLREIIRTRSLFMPRLEITIALKSPAPIDRSRLLFGYGRV